MHLIRDRNLVFSLIPIKGGTRNIRRFFGHTIYVYICICIYIQKNQWSYNSVFARSLSIIFYFGCNLLRM